MYIRIYILGKGLFIEIYVYVKYIMLVSTYVYLNDSHTHYSLYLSN